jgi:CubicO group peptidase (beta-lactamase class C family)
VKPSILLILLISFGCQFTYGQLSQSLDSLFSKYIDANLFEGTALIAVDSGIVFHKSYGTANHEYNLPNSNNTIYRLGSLNKQFTAMMILQLSEKGKLNLDSPIIKYLPDFRKDIGKIVTIKHLLNHTSGIPNFTALPNVWNDSMKISYSSSFILHNYCNLDLEFKPGSQFKYSNTGYFILAMIIEKTTGKSLDTFLLDNILKPVGMYNTGIEIPSLPVSNKASGYMRIASTYINEPYISVQNINGAANIYSNAYDLYLWDRALYTEKIISKKYLTSFLSPHFKVAPDYSYGYGWEFTSISFEEKDTIQMMQHSGAIRAFRSLIVRIPKEKICIILLSNCASESGYELTENILRLLNGKPVINPKPLLADTLYSVISTEGMPAAVKLYRNLKILYPDRYEFNSASLEWMGEGLLHLNEYEKAAEVFKFALNEFPDYTYGWLYLGRAYEKNGRNADAINAYENAVKKDKNSRPGRDAAFQLNYLKQTK